MSYHRHAVLVPGFVGFDALGQLRYYAGVTSCFQTWKVARADVTLHYFDNFPTASVELRAQLLKRFLAKKFARGEIAAGDEVTLIGHSTGGLDVRRLMQLLVDDAAPQTVVDDRHPVSHSLIKDAVKRLVFLSVPHYGTNLADYLTRFQPVVQGVVRDLGLSVQLNRPPVSNLRKVLAERFLPETCAHIIYAINDALNESDEGEGGTEAQRANERRARSELALWLEHMGKDFDALLDLTSAPRHPPKSPAHLDAEARGREIAAWPAGLETRSYATFVPADRVDRSVAIAWIAALLKRAAGPASLVFESLNSAASSWPAVVLPGAAVLTRLGLDAGPVGIALACFNARPSALFELAYALCADPSGPFRSPPYDPTFAPEVTFLNTSGEGRLPTAEGPRPSATLRASDNDGIVNTLSMLWPFDAGRPGAHEAFLVEADHADIIGHHSLFPQPLDPQNDRQYEAYNILQANVPFGQAAFGQIWRHIFGFAFGG
jgi:triacylglycerol lipase